MRERPYLRLVDETFVAEEAPRPTRRRKKKPHRLEGATRPKPSPRPEATRESVSSNNLYCTITFAASLGCWAFKLYPLVV